MSVGMIEVQVISPVNVISFVAVLPAANTSDNVLSGIKPMMSPIVKVFVSRLDATVPIT